MPFEKTKNKNKCKHEKAACMHSFPDGYASDLAERGALNPTPCFLPAAVCVIWRKRCSSKHLRSCSPAKSLLVPSSREILSEFVEKRFFQKEEKKKPTIRLQAINGTQAPLQLPRARGRPEVTFCKASTDFNRLQNISTRISCDARQRRRRVGGWGAATSAKCCALEMAEAK